MALRVSRRAAIVGLGLAAAWRSGPLAALADTGGGDARIEALVARMTIGEKAGQLTLRSAAWGAAKAAAANPPASADFDAQLADAVAGRLTGVFNGNGAAMCLAMQRAVMARSRLKVPLMFGADVIHGHRTMFPLPIGEAASFDPDLAERTARVAAVEAAGAGLDWTFAPMVDVARDQRWGRAGEGAGEDIRLNAAFAAARVRGFQGRDLSADDAILACPKHFAGYGASASGLDYNPVDMSERTLREVYLPPFEAAYRAGALSTMAAFHEIAGVPSTASDWLLTQLLRREMGFEGFVVSDYESDRELIAHGVAADDRDAARLAILAGVDMSMQSDLYMLHLPDLVAKGEVPVARVDQAVRRVLSVKARLGLFDDPFRRIDPKREAARSRRPAHLRLAREAARRSIVMLRNEGELLPLKKAGRIALIGPFADDRANCNGPQSVYGNDADPVDLASGVRAAMGPGATVTVTRGCDPEAALPGGIEAAVAAARAADVVVLAVGEHARMAGEAQSRMHIGLPPVQQALADAVIAAGTPVVVVLRNGRGLALEGGVRAAGAILVTWFLGSQTGHAIADILFGDHSPSGRLPVSFPQASGQQPYAYDHKPTGRPQAPATPRPVYRTYWREGPNAALYPFGHGLTYGRVGYSGLAVPATLTWDGSIEIVATLTHIGGRAVEEIAQLYVRDPLASLTRPVRELKGWQRVALKPGETRQVRFTLSRADLTFIGRDMKPVAEPGAFIVRIAPDAEAEGVSGRFRLSGPA